MIKFSSQKKKKRNCQNLSLFTCGWLVGEPSCPFFFFLSGKENLSCSYAVMPNCGRRSEHVRLHKKEKKKLWEKEGKYKQINAMLVRIEREKWGSKGK